jgi:hypothetical protein
MPARNVINQTLMKQLIQETEIVGMSEKEALKYIEAKLGKPISGQTLYRYKQAIRSDPDRNGWLSYYARAGFIDHYRDLLAQMQLVQRDLMRSWIEENAKPDKTMKDKLLIQQLAKNLRENITVLSQLGLGAPIIASMKAIVDKTDTTNTNTSTSTITQLPIQLKEGIDYEYTDRYQTSTEQSKKRHTV